MWEVLVKKDELTVVFAANKIVENENTSIIDVKPLIDGKKTLIEGANPSIELRKEAFSDLIDELDGYSISKEKLLIIFDSFCDGKIFGRKEIMDVCSVEITAAGDLLNKLKACHTITPVSGHGKGKYRFII